jgi:hypothetical protein
MVSQVKWARPSPERECGLVADTPHDVSLSLRDPSGDVRDEAVEHRNDLGAGAWVAPLDQPGSPATGVFLRHRGRGSLFRRAEAGSRELELDVCRLLAQIG